MLLHIAIVCCGHTYSSVLGVYHEMVLMGHGFNFIATASIRTNMGQLEISLSDAPKLQVCANTCFCFCFSFWLFYWVCSDVALLC